jgi:hypothetical protein
MEDSKMKKIGIENKNDIKQLLYNGIVFGIKDNRYRSFGGFQLWWYDKQLDVCNSCESNWSERRKRIHKYSLNRAANILRHNRRSLYVRSKQLIDDKRLMTIGHYAYAM